MILHENPLPAGDSHEISCLICYFWKSCKICNHRLLQIIGGALRVNNQMPWKARYCPLWDCYLNLLFCVFTGSNTRMYLINTLLSELDGLGVNNSNLFVIGAVTRWVNPMVSRNYVPYLRGSRKFTGSNTRMYLINTLLSELDGLGVNNSNLFVIGAVTRWVNPMVSRNYVTTCADSENSQVLILECI